LALQVALEDLAPQTDELLGPVVLLDHEHTSARFIARIACTVTCSGSPAPIR
jgi:hypothetical protein